MERLFTFWQKYTPVPAHVKRYIEEHAQIREYLAGEYFMQAGERMPYWCLVLAGLACGYTIDEEGGHHIHWFALPYQGFIGVQHLYTQRRENVYIQFLRPTTIIQLYALRMREAKEQFPEVSELIHVLKQRFIGRQYRLIQVLQIMDGTERIIMFKQAFPILFSSLNPEQLAAHLNLSLSTVYRALRKFNRP